MSDGEHDVFLSYASADVDIARRICAELEAQQYSVWWDSGRILAGDDLTEIFDAVQRCRYFLVILTASSVESRFVREELSIARIQSIEQGQVKVIPILYESCPIPPGLRSKVFLDFTKSSHEGLRELVETLRNHDRRRRGEAETSARTLAQPTLGDAVAKLTREVREATEIYVVTDLGGTKAYVSVMTQDGERLFDRKFTTQSQDDSSGLLSFLVTSIEGALHGVHQATGISLNEIRSKIQTYAIAFAGPTDSDLGIVRDASNFEIENYPLAENLSNRLGRPVFVDNDANLGVLGEAWKGVAREYRNVVGIVIGTGIGGGIVIDRQLYRGSTSTAGEIGHMVIDVNSSVMCGCGQLGCFEALASRKAIARDLHRKKLQNSSDVRWDENNLGSAELADYIRDGDADAVEVFRQAVKFWAKAVFILLNVLNPDIIFFGGGFVQQLGEMMGDSFLDPVRAEAEKCMNSIYESKGKKVPIVIGQLDNPMLSGACLLAIRGNRTPISRTDIVAAAVAGLGEREFKVLRSVYNRAEPTRISTDPGSDFHEDRMRGLRNRGLIATSNGASFRRSRHVEITLLGRVVIEDAAS